MPYKLSQKAVNIIDTGDEFPPDLTNLQTDALIYLDLHRVETRFIDAAEVAHFYGYPNGQYFRGVLASLYKKGLLIKGEKE